MLRTFLACVGGLLVGALTMALLIPFGFGPPMWRAIPIMAALIFLVHSEMLLMELFLGNQRAILAGWITGAFGGLIMLAFVDYNAGRISYSNPLILPAGLLIGLALRPLKPKLKARLAARLGRPTE